MSILLPHHGMFHLQLKNIEIKLTLKTKQNRDDLGECVPTNFAIDWSWHTPFGAITAPASLVMLLSRMLAETVDWRVREYKKQEERKANHAQCAQMPS